MYISNEVVLFLFCGHFNARNAYGEKPWDHPRIQAPLDKSDFRSVEHFFCNRCSFGRFSHVESDPNSDKSDIFRQESELTNSRKTANALHTAHSRPYYGATLPIVPLEQKYRSRKVLESC